MRACNSNDDCVSPQERFLLERIDYERAQSMPCSEEAFKLDRMRALLHRLGDPQQGLRIVHVAGTKGKGSTAAMMAAVLSAAGYRTGLFTSPHLDRVEERIVVDGSPCSPEELAELIDLIRPAVEELDRGAADSIDSDAANDPNSTAFLAAEGLIGNPGHNNPPEQGPTYFEIITAAALCHFVRAQATAVVLEVGLGGRLDSTNVCMPCLSIITSISFDHTKQLGNTLAAIAAEKAGIIKPGVPVISGVTLEEPRDVVREAARQNGCRLVELGVDFDFDYRPPLHLEEEPKAASFDFCEEGTIRFKDLTTGLLGRHQAGNAALVVAAVEELRRSAWTIPDAALRRGLSEVSWPARVEVIARRPTIVLDAAHNAASIAALVEVLGESFSARRRLLVFATTREKDLPGMLGCLQDQFDHIIFTRYLKNPRSVPPEDLAEAAKRLAGQSIGGAEKIVLTPFLETPFLKATPAEAWDAVCRMAGPEDLVCITGSFFIAAEMRREIAARPFAIADCR